MESSRNLQFSLASPIFWAFYHIVVKKNRQTCGGSRRAGWKALFCLGLSLGFVMSAAAAADDILWEMDLSRYNLGPVEEISQGVEIVEEGNERFLRKLDSETQFFFSKELKTPEFANWCDIVFRVRFREPAKSTFALVVKRGGQRNDVSYMQYYVGIQPDQVSLRCHGLPKELPVEDSDPRVVSIVKYSELGLAPIEPGQWITAEATIGSDTIKISVDAGDGVARKVEFPTFAGTGSVTLLARSPVDIASASVRDAGKGIGAKP